MNKPIKVTDSSSADTNVPVRRRTQGPQTVAISFTVPKELNQRINGILVETKKTRSLVLTELIEKGLESYE